MSCSLSLYKGTINAQYFLFYIVSLNYDPFCSNGTNIRYNVTKVIEKRNRRKCLVRFRFIRER